MKNFSKRLKTAMAVKGINQKELSELSNITQPLLSKYEKGKALPNLDNIVKLTQALKISFEDLFINDEDKIKEKTLSKEQSEFLEKFSRITDEGHKSIIKELINSFSKLEDRKEVITITRKIN